MKIEKIRKHCEWIIDHFKEINDTFGHSIGDLVITETSEKIQLLFANFDLVGRFGGDEFCVLMTGTDIEKMYENGKFRISCKRSHYLEGSLCENLPVCWQQFCC